MAEDETPNPPVEKRKKFKKSERVPFRIFRHYPGICQRCGQPRPVSKQCAAKSRTTQERCKQFAHPGKNVCIVHGALAGRKPSTYRYATVLDKCPELKENYGQLMEEVESLGGKVDLSVAEEITLLRARIMTALAPPGVAEGERPPVDPKIVQDMWRDLTRTLQKEREIEIGLQKLIPREKANQMLQLVVKLVTRFIPASSQEECWDELGRALAPFADGNLEFAELPAIADATG